MCTKYMDEYGTFESAAMVGNALKVFATVRRMLVPSDLLRFAGIPCKQETNQFTEIRLRPHCQGLETENG